MIIERFQGTYEFLSNFYPSPIRYRGFIWPTSEHLYQAAKTENWDERHRVRMASSPSKAKRLAQTVTLKSNWEAIKQNVMLACLNLKFRQSSKLQKRLLETNESQLIEGNHWHDNTWGDCFCNRCRNIEGSNLLGVLLMQVRHKLLNEN